MEVVSAKVPQDCASRCVVASHPIRHSTFRLAPAKSLALMRTLIAFLFITAAAFGAGGPENALIVVNADSWASTCVANEYIAARSIPPDNVVYLRDIPSFERMDVEQFRERILRPVLRTAEERGLSSQIDYILYSADFPTAIDVAADMAGKEFPKTITPLASINSLTFYYQFTLSKNPGYLGMNTNFYFRQRSLVAPEKPWPEADKKTYNAALAVFFKVSAAREKAREKKDEQPKPESLAEERQLLMGARATFLKLKVDHPKSTELLYNIACIEAQVGNYVDSVSALGEAIENGWWDMQRAQQDPDLRSVRDREDFKALMARARAVKFEISPSSGFRSSVGWLPNGQVVPAGNGVRYLLSTMLAYTSGRGNSVREAVAGLRRSVGADGTRPLGTVYFLENNDVRSTTREWGFSRAAEKLRDSNVAASVEKGILPQNKNDVAGLTAGVADFDWAKSGSTILLGAICEHLTSFGGMLHEGDTQTPLTDFLRHGAAGASGTVNEPYAIQAKFPTPFIHWHYANGCTLAEAFYQSVAAPYQLLIVGDALCSPWKKRFTVKADGVKVGAAIKGSFTVKPVVESADGLKPASFELYLDGHRSGAGGPNSSFTVDTAKLHDGPLQITLAANSLDAVSTRASINIPVVVRNSDVALNVTAPSGDWSWDKPITLKAAATGASAILFRQNGREVGRIANGAATIDPRTLGQGPVRIQPVALLDGGREIWSEQILLNITPPAAIPAQSPAIGMVFENGFYVTPAGGAAALVQKAEGDWLAKAGVVKDGEFAIEAWLRVPSDDVYQFQLRGPSKLRVIVDGQTLDWPRGKEWWFLPAHLARGPHRIRIEGKADGTPQLDARFGGPGCLRLDGARFQHAKAK